jgi:cytochrome c biogenesis protein ResB
LVGGALGIGVVVAREAVGELANRAELEGFKFRVSVDLGGELVIVLSFGLLVALLHQLAVVDGLRLWWRILLFRFRA